jgi:putative membrane protein
MMYWDSGWAWLWMALMMVIFCGALVVALFAVFAVVRRPDRDFERSSDARDILDARFARGEIDAHEYEQRRRILDGAAQPTRP